ncbi:MAG: hypothetical protein LQ337_003376 [Flavoplaca oasis]|nr:MAG: hypothetical protein LQ337_003376 [Flavoplaca oasis]
MTLFGFITGYEPGYEHGYEYDKKSRKGAWTRKGAHHAVGSDDYQKPSRKASVRSSKCEQAPPDYFPEQEGCFEEPIQYQPLEVHYSNHAAAQYQQQVAQYQQQAAQYSQHVSQLQQQYPHVYDHPAQVQQHDSGFHEQASRSRQPSAHLSCRQTVHRQPEPRERSRYPDDPVPQGSIRRSATHSSKHMPPPSRSHQGTHLSVQYSNHASSKPTHRSSQPTHRSGSHHLEPVYEGQERHSVQQSRHESHRQSQHGSSHHASRADQGRQFTVHNDFASKAPSHTGSARTGSGKQKAKLFGGNKEMTLADF